MITSRLALSAGLGHGSRSVVVLRGSAALGVVGAVVTGLAMDLPIAGLGLTAG